jgi:hypothetical protein
MPAPTLECRLINASIAAYYIKDGELPPNSPGYDKIGLKPGTVPAIFSGGTDQIDAGYLAQTEDDLLFLVFRGTLPPTSDDFWQWIDDWLNDLRIEPMSWPVAGKPFGQAETGFATAVLDLWPQVVAALKDIDLGTIKGIFVTGHSKGAAASFLAATLLKGQDTKDMLVEVCCFAPPLVTDAMFRVNYDKLLRIGSLTVRYQNEYDIVPFLPYWPALDALAATERMSRGANFVIHDQTRERAIANDYVPVGNLRLITTTCAIEYGERAEAGAWNAIKDALWRLEFEKIIEAHAAEGRYLTCLCS